MAKKTKAMLEDEQRSAWLDLALDGLVASFNKRFKKPLSTGHSYSESTLAIWYQVKQELALKGGKRCR
jgi:hypothetical protein